MNNYFDILNHVLKNGKFRPDRTGTGTQYYYSGNLSDSCWMGYRK